MVVASPVEEAIPVRYGIVSRHLTARAMTDDAPHMMQTGPHTFVQWDTARRLGLSEWAPEVQVFAETDKGRREKRAVRGSLEGAAKIVAEDDRNGPGPFRDKVHGA